MNIEEILESKKTIEELKKQINTWNTFNRNGEFDKHIELANLKLKELEGNKNEVKPKSKEVINIEVNKKETVVDNNKEPQNELDISIKLINIGEDITDKEYYTKEGKPIKLPINSSQVNIKNKKVNALNLGILTYFSNYQDIHEVEEFDGYDTDRYIYENKIIKNKEEIEKYSKTKIDTFIRNARKLSKLADEKIITVEEHKGENVYRINKGSKYVLIERKILEVLIECCSSEVIKMYIFFKWRVGTKGGIVSRKEIADNVGYSTKSKKQLSKISNDIEKFLIKFGLIKKEKIILSSTEDNQYNKACYYEITPYEEWIEWWNNGKNAIDFNNK